MRFFGQRSGERDDVRLQLARCDFSRRLRCCCLRCWLLCCGFLWLRSVELLEGLDALDRLAEENADMVRAEQSVVLCATDFVVCVQTATAKLHEEQLCVVADSADLRAALGG